MGFQDGNLLLNQGLIFRGVRAINKPWQSFLTWCPQGPTGWSFRSFKQEPLFIHTVKEKHDNGKKSHFEEDISYFLLNHGDFSSQPVLVFQRCNIEKNNPTKLSPCQCLLGKESWPCNSNTLPCRGHKIRKGILFFRWPYGSCYVDMSRCEKTDKKQYIHGTPAFNNIGRCSNGSCSGYIFIFGCNLTWLVLRLRMMNGIL